MADNVSKARFPLSRRLKAASLFAICLIVLTALLELGLVVNPSM